MRLHLDPKQFFLAGWFVAASASSQEALLEMRVLDLVNADALRPVRVNLWYQATACARTDKFCLSADVDPDKVVFLSHGALGSANELNWLGYGLAQRGWVVAGISHYGESWVYGTDTVDVANVLRAWQRPEDISFALSALTDAQPFDRDLNWNAVAAIGHSSGGQTVAALAGIRLDMQLMTVYCALPAAEADLGCRYARQWGGTVSGSLENRMAASYHDPRINRIVMLDPALGPGATVESLRSVRVPTLIVGAVQNDFLPFAEHAARYAQYIPEAELLALEKNEGHFVFIDTCEHGLDAQGVALCRDRPGVVRTQVQEALLPVIAAFLE